MKQQFCCRLKARLLRYLYSRALTVQSVGLAGLKDKHMQTGAPDRKLEPAPVCKSPFPRLLT
jgi:hypothetical protein